MSSDERKPASEAPPEHPRNTILERLVKRGIESGMGAFTRSEDTVRGLIDGMKLPKEAANVVLDQIDETKKGLYTVVAKEIRDFLQTTNFAGDVKKILTGLAFEVKMEVRFKPTENDDGQPEGIKPDVQAQANLKSTRKRTRTMPAPDSPKEPPKDE
ncbi:MAG: hypothetical protein U0326_04125 [Polyangiales bacterium]